MFMERCEGGFIGSVTANFEMNDVHGTMRGRLHDEASLRDDFFDEGNDNGDT